MIILIYCFLMKTCPHIATHTHAAVRINVAEKVGEALTASDLD